MVTKMMFDFWHEFGWIFTHLIPSLHSLDSKVHGANMGPIWDRQDPGGPHVGPMNFEAVGIYCTLQIATLYLDYI